MGLCLFSEEGIFAAKDAKIGLIPPSNSPRISDGVITWRYRAYYMKQGSH